MKIFELAYAKRLSRMIACGLAAGFFLPNLVSAAHLSPLTENDFFMTQAKSRANPSVDALEIVGIGVSLETWRIHSDYPEANLWSAVEQSKGGYIISTDPGKYPKDLNGFKMLDSKRLNDTVDAAMRDFMDMYPIPTAVVAPTVSAPTGQIEIQMKNARSGNADSFVVTPSSGPYTAVGQFPGLLTQRGQVMNSYLNDNPDKLWNTVFMTFDENGDVPAVGVGAMDGVLQRAAAFSRIDRPKFDTLMEPAYHPKHPRVISENIVFLAMVKRGRIDWLRPFAPFIKDNMKVETFGDGDPSRNSSAFDGWKKEPPQPFVPTRFIAKPWTAFQLDQYDHLENLGTLYRPQVVSYLDEHGKPIKATERKVRMEAALRAALAPLKGKMPARILYDYGSVLDDRNSATRFLPLVQGLRAIDEEFDLLDTKRGYDLARILGDTGAGSPFVGVALASMAGRQSGGATLVANMRRDDGATLLLVTPPSAEQVAKDAAIKRPFWPRPGQGRQPD
ncbi:MAG: DUF2875 family protein [Pseudomonadota bacterium]